MKNRDISIDILKFFGALLITNSHMEILYHPYEFLATGGSIGDVLFFFASGFTLFLKPVGRFDNWYKKRVSRIYPSVFAFAIFKVLLFSDNSNIVDVILYGGNWFVSCIMIYYILFYLINKFLLPYIKVVVFAFCAIILVWYFLLNRAQDYNMYGVTYFKWGHYFLFMLLGALVGFYKDKIKYSYKFDLAMLLLNILLFYFFYFLSKKYFWASQCQIISLIPLLGTTFYFYKVGKSPVMSKLYFSPLIGSVIKVISGLCLEIYFVQFNLFTDKMNRIFPLNIFLMFVIIVFFAYLLRCFSRCIAQTFSEAPYNWKDVFRPF